MGTTLTDYFRGWSAERIAEHNARVERRKREFARGEQSKPVPLACAVTAASVIREKLVDEKKAKLTAEDKLNKTEREFLMMFRASHPRHTIRVQAIRLELANDTRYTPDFNVTESDGSWTFYEIKGGFVREDSWIKLKTAARQYPEIKFVKAQKTDGHWIYTEIPK